LEARLIVGPSGSGKTSMGTAMFGAGALYAARLVAEKADQIDEIAPGGRSMKSPRRSQPWDLAAWPAWFAPIRSASRTAKSFARIWRALCVSGRLQS